MSMQSSVDSLQLPDRAIIELRNTIRGKVIQSTDKQYDAACRLYNAMIDKQPRLIVRCANVADVMECVKFAHTYDLETAIRSGGHNGPGLGSVADGLVIDLSLMKGIRVNTKSQTVRVEPGCTWGDVDHATHAFGLATVSGIISTTGVGGLTLGGGHGYLSRKYGLTIDNLLSADVVLADGRLVHASKTEHPDLFWALRGGGGNFGVVTSFEYRLHPVKNVVAGPLFWPVDRLEPTLKWYRKWLPQAPREVGAFYLTAEVPAGDPFPKEIHGRKVCGLMWFFDGSVEESNKFIQQVRGVAQPLFEFIGSMPYPAVQSMFDGLYPPGDHWYWKGDFVRELSDEAIAIHKQYGEVPTSKSTMHLYPVNGAVNAVEPTATAWNRRDANWSMVIVGVDSDSSINGRIRRWARDYWEALHPHTLGGAYINFMMEEGEDRIRATYGENYKRLQKTKTKYDPHNFFHVNQNIQPYPVK